MDTKFVISQLITAVITIITTIIVVRVTLKGGLDISQTLSSKFKIAASKYGKYTPLIIDLFGLAVMIFSLYRWVWQQRFVLPNRAEVFWISLFATLGVVFLIQTFRDLFTTGLISE